MRSFLMIVVLGMIFQLQAMAGKKVQLVSTPLNRWSDPAAIFQVKKAPSQVKFYDYYQSEEYAYTQEDEYSTTDFYDVGIVFTTPHTENLIVKLVVTTYYTSSYYQQTLYIPVAAYVNSWVLRTLDLHSENTYGQTVYYKVASISDVYPA